MPSKKDFTQVVLRFFESSGSKKFYFAMGALCVLMFVAITLNFLVHPHSEPNFDFSSYQVQQFENTHDALEDPDRRISKDFHVPEILKKRVSFWFDIYTKHGTQDFLIHHSRYPWIVYEHVDASRFMSGTQPYWVKRRRAERFVERRKREIRHALRKLSRRKNYKNLKGDEALVFEKLTKVRGSRKAVLKYATRRVRVQLGQKDFFVSGLRNSHRYINRMENIFEQTGLPKELTRIPFVESSFNVQARSKAGASGIWQIMPRTGRAFGAKISRYFDERNSPIKATEISASLLKQNYRSLKNWPLAVTAYNHGTGNLRSSLRRSKSKTLPQVITRLYSGSFRFASANFYTSFLAALHAETYHREIFKPEELDREKPLELFSVKLKKPASPQVVAEVLSLNVDKIYELNLDLRRKKGSRLLLPRGYTLYLPLSVKRLPQRSESLIQASR